MSSDAETSSKEEGVVHSVGSPIKCVQVDPAAVRWDELDRFADRTVFQTREWIAFVSQSQKATPIVVELREGGEVAGYFTGLTFTRFGVKILGSSFPGWTTPYMGFNLRPGISRAAALAAVERMAWDELKCTHMEISDPYFSVEDGKSLGFACEFYHSYRTDLRLSEEELFNSMESACRRCIRKAEKSGVQIEEANDPAFADEFYAQLQDVFAKQKLAPTYGVERVQSLIRNVKPGGNLLLLRARDPEGKCIATGIFPGYNKIAEFWGNASWRASQNLRPNEAIHWYAMRYWKGRGAEIYDWGGEGAYKEKYGCVPFSVPWFMKSRYRIVSRLRGAARKMFARRQRLAGWLRGQRDEDTES
ncbi:MAG TPA: GNAT family N-acetyltransferase [Candidatus Aquilonibacter sp.]|nr:GNAT family N-acetyltransferase [Candidatus Aquilonibacter sp.]